MTHVRRGWWLTAACSATALLGGVRAAAAQDAVVRGRVTSDRGEPIAAASVIIEELRAGINTGADGRYTLFVPAARVRGQDVVVRFRAVGFKPGSKAIKLIPGEQAVDMVLTYDVNLLEAVVVTGVQQATEAAKVPFAVSRVDAAAMPVPGANPLTQIQGKVPGADIVSASGRPGAQPAVLLRGVTSLNGAGGRGQDPLYIVDGIIINGGLPDINPEDIDNVEVVKGAAAASLYGSRAANGVINITTRSGRRALEGVHFHFRNEVGTNDIERDFGLAQYHALVMDEHNQQFCAAVNGQPLCARTFNYYYEQFRINNDPGFFALSPPGFPIDPGSTITGANPFASGNVLKERFQIANWPGPTYNAVRQTINPQLYSDNSLDMQGRVGTTQFYASGSNLTQQGAIRFLQGIQRNTFRMNVDQLIGDAWNIAFRSQYTRSTQDGLNQEGGGNAFFVLTRVPGIVNVLQRDTLGRLYIRPNLQGGGSQNANPLYQLENIQRNDVTNRFLGGVTVQFTPPSLRWFTLDGSFSYDIRRQATLQFQDKGYRTTTSANINQGSLLRSTAGLESMNGGVNAVLRHSFRPDLNASVRLSYLYEQRKTETQSGSGNFLSVKGVTSLVNTRQETRTINSTQEDVRQIGLFAGATVEFKERYILESLIRRDGSSLFGGANRWATFGRISGEWRLAREPWWFIPQIDEFKLRAVYGTAGRTPSFAAQYETFAITAGGVLQPGTLGNKDLKPELSKELEVGIDVEMLNRYALNLTFARANIDRQILQAPVPASSGFSSQWQNAGALRNTTWEAALNVPLVQQRDLSWSMRFIYDRTRSYISRLDVPLFYYGATLQGTGSIFLAQQGERVGNFYGHKFITNCTELPAPYNGDCGFSGASFQRNDDGLIVWVGAGNSTGDGITRNLWETQLANGPWGVTLNWGIPILLRGADKAPAFVALGNALPNFHFAVSQEFSWRRISAHALVDAAIGQRVWDQGFHWAHLDFLSKDVDQVGKTVETAKPIGYYWRTSPADGFSGLGGFYDQLLPNNYTVEDASYAKLRELMVSYRVGPISGVGNWEVSVIGRNLFTITGYRGFDPEVGIGGGDTGSAAVNAVDAFTFPNLRTFSFAVSTTF